MALISNVTLTCRPAPARRPLEAGDPAELLSIIVPVYNEVRTIRAVLDRLLAVEFSIPREILVVDDGSTDGTGGVLEKAEDDRLDIVALRAERNAGRGAPSVAACSRRAGRSSRSRTPTSARPRQIPALVAPILGGTAHVVYGSRFLNGRSGAP